MSGLGSAADRQAQLRGELKAEQLGARGLERMARNPACGLLKALTVAGVSPATVVTDVYKEASREGQSPFALNAGNQFEEGLFESGAARLLNLYRTSGRLGLTECKVVSVPDLAPGATRAAMDRRQTVSTRLLSMKLAGDPAAPNIILKPRLTVMLLGLVFNIEPDALVAADADAFYTPVEIKSYPDRAGKTDPIDIRGACRQAGVAIVALRAAAGRLGAPTPQDLIPARGDLVLRQPGSNFPTLRPMTLQGEVDSLERALTEAPRDLGETEALLESVSPTAALDSAAVLDTLPNNYRDNCREFCALARRCKQRALAQGDPVVLGGRAREEFAAAGSLERVFELLDGRGFPPRSRAEQVLQQRLQEEYRELEKAVI
jgi:hypothetical protein